MASFLLHCSICPKAPNFSDLSHLLTHLASKGHLSHYFKAQVRSRQEPSLQSRLQEYDRWYRNNNLEKHLSERLMLKDRKFGVRTRGVGAAVGVSKRPTRRSTALGEVQETSSRGAIEENVIDPRLSQTNVVPGDEVPQRSRSNAAARVPSWKCNPLSRTQIWVDRTSVDADTASVPVMPDGGEEGEGAEDGIAIERRFPRHEDFIKTPRRRTSSKLRLFEDENAGPTSPSEVGGNRFLTEATDLETKTEEEDKLSECTRLKGVIWPGMDLFDSAGLDAKRLRNQKKHTSVLEEMRAHSQGIEPNEVIYFPSWEMKKSRFISGRVESSSPVREESPASKHRQRRAGREPLAALDANAPTRAKKSRTRKPARLPLQTGLVSPDMSTLNSMSPLGPRQGAAYISRCAQRHAVHESGFTSSLRARARAKRTFEVYDDASGLCVDVQPNLSRASRSNQDQLFLQDTPCPAAPAMSCRPWAPPPSINDPQNVLQRDRLADGLLHGGQFPNPFGSKRSTGQENIEPIIDKYGRIDRLVRPPKPPRATQRYFVVQGEQAPQFYTNMAPLMEYNRLHRSPPQAACTVNPLSLSFKQVPFGPFSGQHILGGQTATSVNPLLEGLPASEAMMQRPESDDETIDGGIDEKYVCLDGARP